MQSIRGFYPQTLIKSPNLRLVSLPKPNQELHDPCVGQRNMVSQYCIKKVAGRMQSRCEFSSQKSFFFAPCIQLRSPLEVNK